MTAVVECQRCHRSMRPSPDGLGPKCRAREHPKSVAAKTFRPPRARRGGQPYPGQLELELETPHA